VSRSTREREARFERLFAETRGDLLAYAVRRAASPEDAADVLGETFLIAWRKLDSLPPGDQARLWLFGVARNVLRRGASRDRAIEAVVERLAGELRGAAALFQLPEEQRSPELWAALKRLPESQREVVLLAAWEELSPREIAAVTGAPVNLVRVRLHRARARLKRELPATPEDAEGSAIESAQGETLGRMGAAGIEPATPRV
jgi:RNA polymerase sigma factor (sigma-70 family)